MREISLREANQKFSTCIAEVEGGEHLVLTRRGKPVAEIRPFSSKHVDTKRENARKQLHSLLNKGFDLGGKPFTEEERHGR